MLNTLRCSNKEQGGFTLLELLIALTILAIGLLALAAMQGVAINSNSVANKQTVHSMLAQQAVEDIASYAYSDGIFSSTVSGATYSTMVVTGAGTYNATYAVNLAPVITDNLATSATQTTLASIKVTVTHNASGNSKSYTVLKLVK